MKTNMINFNAILQLSINDKKILIINDKYICEFVMPNNLDDKLLEHYKFFNEFSPDVNCPRLTSYANVNVYDNDIDTYDHDIGQVFHGKIFCNIDRDLQIHNGGYSLMLYLYEDAEYFKPLKAITVCTCEIKDINRLV